LDSSAAILKVFDSCRDLETIILSLRDLRLESSDTKALASLPRLKFLNVGFCKITEEAFSFLSRCGKLKRLGIECCDGLNDLLRVFGMNLVSLDIQSAAAETWLGIVENCPNLEYIQLYGKELKDVVMVGSLNDGLKKRMKRLVSMNVNLVPVRLGTEWKGY
jgi:Leucine-rich repeat (LRR) protein